MCTVLGWGWEQAECELDLYRVAALLATWRRTPPAAWLLRPIAMGHGWQPGAAAESAATPSAVRAEAADALDLMDDLRAE
jgi:hypothetical protein